MARLTLRHGMLAEVLLHRAAMGMVPTGAGRFRRAVVQEAEDAIKGAMNTVVAVHVG